MNSTTQELYLYEHALGNLDPKNLYNISSKSVYGLQIIPDNSKSNLLLKDNISMDELLIEDFAIILNHLKYQDTPIYLSINSNNNDNNDEVKPSPLRDDLDLYLPDSFPEFADDEMEAIEDTTEDKYAENPQEIKDWKEKKKAPNGSACEKHKRWKKRCPSNCPHRKSRKRKGTNTDKSIISHKAGIQKIIQDNEKKQEIVPWAPWNINTPTDSIGDDQERIKEFLGQVVINTKDFSFERPQREITKRRRMSEDELLESDETIAPLKRKVPTRKFNSHACAYHRMLHARCPLRCPQRISINDEENQKKISTFDLYI